MEIVVGWSALLGPKNLPKKVQNKWVDVLQKIKKNVSWNKLTQRFGSLPDIKSHKETKAFVRN